MVRQLAAPFVAVPPSGTSTETRLSVSDDEDALLWELYRYGGKLKATDLRCLVELNANGIEYDEKARMSSASSLLGEYGWWASNPHEPFGSLDFESSASALFRHTRLTDCCFSQ